MKCPMCNSKNIYKKLHIVKEADHTEAKRFYICRDCNCVWQTEDMSAYHSYSIIRRNKKHAAR